MSDTVGRGYDTSAGTEDRSAVTATKVWGIVLALVALVGIAMIFMFLTGTNRPSSGPVSSENTATRPAEP